MMTAQIMLVKEAEELLSRAVMKTDSGILSDFWCEFTTALGRPSWISYLGIWIRREVDSGVNSVLNILRE